MDTGMQSMIEHLETNTGKNLEQWIEIVKQMHITKHSDIINALKDSYALTYGFANMIAHKALGTDADSVSDKNDLIKSQYKGKENFLPLYDMLISEIIRIGDDIEIAPKKTYVSLRRKKQFAMLQPTSKSHFEIGLNLKGQEAKGILEEITSANAMCTHRIIISSINEINDEVLSWVKAAYSAAG